MYDKTSTTGFLLECKTLRKICYLRNYQTSSCYIHRPENMEETEFIKSNATSLWLALILLKNLTKYDVVAQANVGTSNI